MTRYLGSFFCDHCSHGMRESIWLLDSGSRLCAVHYQAIVGESPPSADPLGTPAPDLAAAAPAWQRIVPGLRMRRAAAAPGIEIQGVRNLRLGEATSTVGDTAVWQLNDAALVDLVLAASAHRDDPEPNKLVVRSLLLRILHGTVTP